MKRRRKSNSWVWMLGLAFLLLASRAFALPDYTDILLQNAVTANGNGTEVTISTYTSVLLEVTISGTATVNFEGSVSGPAFKPMVCNTLSTPATSTSATGIYECNVTKLTKFRTPVSGYSSGNITVFARVASLSVIRSSQGGPSASDNTVFATGPIGPMGALYDTTPPAITDGNIGVPRMDVNRQLLVNCGTGCSGGASTPTDAFANPTTASLSMGFNMGWNGATWDRLQVDGSKFLKVNCSAGCSATSFADNAAFTFGTTSIGLSGYVVDDTATNAVAENSAGLARMNANRILYAMPTGSTGTALLPAAYVDANTIANQTTTAVHGHLYGYNGATWDRILATGGKILVTPDSVALPANQSVNVAQVAGTNTVTGGVAGIIAVGGNVANAVAATANPVPVGGIFTTAPATLTTGQTATAQFTAAQNLKHDLTTIAGTAPTTVGKLDVKGADGDVFVRQATATNLNAAVVGTGTAGTPAGNILTVQGVAAMTKLLVTPDSVALPANQSVNVAQVAGTNTVTGGVAGIIAVGGNVANAVAATANPVPVGGIFTTTPATLTTGQTATAQYTAAQNLKTDMSTVAGTATVTGTGAGGAGVQRVTVSNDSSLAANQSVNVAQIAATNTVTAAAGVQKVGVVGNANGAFDAAGTNVAAPANELLFGCQFVTAPTTLTTTNIGPVQCNNKGMHFAQLSDGTTSVAVIAGTTALKTDLSSVAGTATVTAAAGVAKVGIVGNANGAIDAANNAAAPANVIVNGFETATQTTTQPTASTTGNVRRGVAATDGVLYAKLGGPVQWQCNLGAVGTTLTQCQAAPGAGLRLYITDIVAVSTTTTTGLFTLRFGTGANCGTGTGNLFFASAAATMPNLPNNAVAGFGGGKTEYITPIVVTANNAVCVLGVVTNTTNIQISGYSAP